MDGTPPYCVLTFICWYFLHSLCAPDKHYEFLAHCQVLCQVLGIWRLKGGLPDHLFCWCWASVMALSPSPVHLFPAHDEDEGLKCPHSSVSQGHWDKRTASLVFSIVIKIFAFSLAPNLISSSPWLYVTIFYLNRSYSDPLSFNSTKLGFGIAQLCLFLAPCLRWHPPRGTQKGELLERQRHNLELLLLRKSAHYKGIR